ncbi:hypothetical protein ABIC94_003033 [Variovorax paradoxus]|jgi:hypothetical protein|uniref:hypothetical protein n=1 Tax=Variovorax paradoxus TaxID=34073 RepID=UPI00339363B1
MKFENLETVFSSAPLEYDNLTIEILLNGEPIARIDREEGLEALKVELLGTDEKLQVRVSLDALIAALQDAREGILSRV